MESTISAGGARPALARAPAAARHPRRPRRLRAILIVANLLALVAAGTLWWLAAHAPIAVPPVVIPVSRGDVDVSIDSNGKTEPRRLDSLAFAGTGTVASVLVKAGDPVMSGQPLARLDDQTLRRAVEKVQADLASAQASLRKLQAGPRADQLASATAALVAAQANLAKVQAGATADDLANAQADMHAAETRLAAVKAGATAEQIANAQADVRAAEANLAKAQAGTSPQDLAAAQADVRAAEANLAKAQAGPTAEELADAEADLQAAQAKVDTLAAGPSAAALAAANAGLQSAQARLAALEAGPTSAQLAAAQLKVSDAQNHLAEVSSSTSLAKQQAETNLEQAANAVRNAQDALAEAAVIGVFGKGEQAILNPDGTFNSDATQAQINHYNAALRAEQDAEGNMGKAQLALEDARKQEILAVGSAQAALDDAKRQLTDLQAGPTPADRAAAQAAIAEAQNTLAQLQAPPTAETRANAAAALTKAQDALTRLKAGPQPADVTAAQAALDKARQNLAKLQAGPQAADIIAAQAALDKARNTLVALRAGPTSADLAAAQATADKARDALAKLKAGPTDADVKAAEAGVALAQTNLTALHATEADLAGAQAAVVQAQTALDSAQAALTAATLTAPFAGTVAEVKVDPGAPVSPSTTVLTLVDTSTLHVDVDLSESDVARVAPGQAVDLTFDALPGQVLTGTVSAVAPVGTSSGGVVTYLVTVQFNPGKVAVRPGMSTNASILIDRRQGVIRVPNRAITANGPVKSVQVLYGPQGTPVTVHVQTGASNGAWTEVTGCLETGNQCLHDGDKLAVNLPTTSGASGGPGNGPVMFFSGPDGATGPGGKGEIVTGPIGGGQ
jgi:HlyD family secretion protein